MQLMRPRMRRTKLQRSGEVCKRESKADDCDDPGKKDSRTHPMTFMRARVRQSAPKIKQYQPNGRKSFVRK